MNSIITGIEQNNEFLNTIQNHGFEQLKQYLLNNTNFAWTKFLGNELIQALGCSIYSGIALQRRNSRSSTKTYSSQRGANTLSPVRNTIKWQRKTLSWMQNPKPLSSVRVISKKIMLLKGTKFHILRHANFTLDSRTNCYRALSSVIQHKERKVTWLSLIILSH